MTKIINADCRLAMQELISAGIFVDAIITDPPYELGFMGKTWDKTGIAYDVEMWKLCLQALKPGGHLLSFGGSRTYHRMACAIEDAGFQIRDQIMWLYGCGFPKSLNISKAIDKMAGVKQKIIGNKWDNFGTALKPAHEPIILARKPLSEKNIASNVLKHGTGGLNIDGCRVSTVGSLGRFPANVIHDGGDEVEAEFVRYGTSKSTAHVRHSTGTPSVALRNLGPYNSGGHADSGSASRFFYCAKASTKERSGSKHPTIKPLALMRYLCRLITPPNGTILDPFAGSGTTGQAAKLEGFDSILIEQSPEYIRHINKRLANDKEH